MALVNRGISYGGGWFGSPARITFLTCFTGWAFCAERIYEADLSSRVSSHRAVLWMNHLGCPSLLPQTNPTQSTMEAIPLTIRVSKNAARVYKVASAEQRRKLDLLLSLKLNDLARDERSLEDVMSDLSRNAQARGLTPEILKQIPGSIT